MDKNSLFIKNASFIDSLFDNQNNTNKSEFKNIYSKKDYQTFLSDVDSILLLYPNEDIFFYKNILFEHSNIEKLLTNFIYNQKMTPGIVLKYGTRLNSDTVIIGNKMEVPFIKKVNENTIYDLASTSKIFTAISVLKLHEYGLLDLNKPISDYVPEFNKLNNITIFDLLSFQKPIKTDKRIDKASSLTEAKEILKSLAYNDNHDKSFLYTDMGCIALRYVIENVTNMSLDEFIEEEIINKCHMTNTALYPKTNNFAPEFNTMTINNEGNAVSYDVPLGLVHDSKARVLGENGKHAPGHAGYFSDANDMYNFAKNITNETLLKKKTALMLSTPVVGNENSYYFGLLNYYKQLNPRYISAPLFLSGKTFLSPGFTGTSLCVDELNDVYGFIGSNRLHNRVYAIPNKFKENIESDNGALYYKGNIVNTKYTYEAQIIMKEALALALKYKYLENVLNIKKENNLVRKINHI